MTQNTAKTDALATVEPIAPDAIADNRTALLYVVPDGRFRIAKVAGVTAKDRPLAFHPSAEGVKFTVTVAEARAYVAADATAEARAAILAGAAGRRDFASKVSPTVTQNAAASAFYADPAAMLASVKSGVLAVVSPGRAEGTKGEPKSDDDALDALFT